MSRKIITENSDWVLSLSWDPEGSYLAAALRRSGGLAIYDAMSGKLDKRINDALEAVRGCHGRTGRGGWRLVDCVTTHACMPTV